MEMMTRHFRAVKMQYLAFENNSIAKKLNLQTNNFVILLICCGFKTEPGVVSNSGIELKMSRAILI